MDSKVANEFVLEYTQKGIYFDENIKIDISIISGNSDVVLLIVPGVDGSVDGYQNKYKKVAESVNQKYGVTVIRMSNPHNPMGYHYRNLFEILDYIEKSYDMQKKRLYMVGHSLGAYMIGANAHIYDFIDKILLINPATGLEQSEFAHMSEREISKNIVLVGDRDPSYKYLDEYSEYATVHVVKGADHHFSGQSFDEFIEATNKYLFE